MENKKKVGWKQKIGLGLAGAGIGLVGIVSIGIKSCQPVIQKQGTFENFYVSAFDRGDSRYIRLSDSKKITGSLVAEDFENDGRFDRIWLFDVPKGHPLEQYVSLDKLESIYRYITKTDKK